MNGTKYDVVVIGSGPGGYVAAIRCSQLGLRAAIIEKDKTFGGTCLNVGCIPSKALLDSTELLVTIRDKAQNHGIRIDNKNLTVDLKQMMARKSQIVAKMADGVKSLLKSNKVDIFEGLARLKDNHTVTIENAEITTDNIILATGSIPMELPGLSFDGKKVVNSTDALSFEEIPKTLAIIGAGAIGLEIGSIWNRLGSKVIIIEMMDQILPQSDSNSAKRLEQILGKQGLDFKLSTKVISSEDRQGKLKLGMKDNNDIQSAVECDKVLIAAGRRPQIKNLGLDTLGIHYEQKSQKISVNKNYQTSVSNIYAIGDIIQGPMLAHKAEDEGIATAEFIAKGFGAVNYDTIPLIVYTWPEYASVGKSEDELIKDGVKYRKGIFQFAANGRALAAENTDGSVKIFSEEKTDRLLGAQILGPWASDLICEVVSVMEFGGSSEDIARTMHAHPTLSEVVREAAMNVENRSIHSLPKNNQS